MAGRWVWAAGGVAAVVGVGAGVAFAESEMRHGGWHDRGGPMGGMFRRARTKDDALERARARFGRFDANGDGTVDRDEITAVLERRMGEGRRGRRGERRFMRRAERMARRFDLNRDGQVTAEEFGTRVSERFNRFDIDADGAITDADLPPMMRGLGVLRSDGPNFGRRRWSRRLERLRRANANGDDRVTREEVVAFAANRFARFDANGDRVVDRADMDARRAEMRDYRASRMLARFGAAGQDSISRDTFLAEVERRFDRRDLDGDGVLSRSERRKGGRGWRRHRGDWGMGPSFGHRRGWDDARGPGRWGGPSEDGEFARGPRRGPGGGADDRPDAGPPPVTEDGRDVEPRNQWFDDIPESDPLLEEIRVEVGNAGDRV